MFGNRGKYVCWLYVLLLFVFGGVLFCDDGNMPKWFYNLQERDNTIIGYGVGKSLKIAKQNARDEIARSIKVEINSQTSIKKYKANGEYSKDIDYSSSQKANMALSDSKAIKSEKIGDKYYVAVAYENLPILQKFANKIYKRLKHKKQHHKTKQNKYLAKTPANKELNRLLKELGAEHKGFGYKNIDFSLEYIQNGYYIKYKNIVQVIDSLEFEKFFANIKSDTIAFRINKDKNLLYDKEEFEFAIKSKQDGYVSIVDVYANGVVSVLLSNEKVSKNKKYIMPNKEYYASFRSNVLHSGKDTYDLFVAIFSKKPIDLDFVLADKHIAKSDRYKQFSNLIDFLDSHTFSSMKVITKAK